jgi:hypothetical protein
MEKLRKRKKSMNDLFPYVWFWRKFLPERKGCLCRVLARGKKNAILVEFEDGYKVITMRYAARLNKPKKKKQQA